MIREPIIETIFWGTCIDRENPSIYAFESAQEHALFMAGVNEAIGWMEYQTLEEVEEADRYRESEQEKHQELQDAVEKIKDNGGYIEELKS
jgi:hypothetical protein